MSLATVLADIFVPKQFELQHILTAFGFGVITAPWSCGLSFYIAFTLTYEVIVFSLCTKHQRTYSLTHRILLNIYAFVGFIIGRILFRKHIFDGIIERDRLHKILGIEN